MLFKKADAETMQNKQAIARQACLCMVDVETMQNLSNEGEVITFGINTGKSNPYGTDPFKEKAYNCNSRS